MNWKKLLSVAIATAALVGCATQPPQAPVSLAPAAVAPATAGKLGLLVKLVEKPNTYFPGAGCLLCLGAAEMTHSALSGHVMALPMDDVRQIGIELNKVLGKRGVVTTVLPSTLALDQLPKMSTEPRPNQMNRDHSGLAKQYGIDRLLVLDVRQLGVERTYAAYIPTEEPKAVLAGVGYIVNLADNTLDWYAPVTLRKAPDGQWDEPPAFPGLTNAYYQVIEQARVEWLAPFGK